MVKSINGADTIPDLLSSHTAQLADIALNVTSKGAKGDGITDDTQTIQNAITSLTNGGVLLIPKGYTFLISSPLNISVQGITITGGGKLLKKAGANCISLNITVDGVVIDGLEIDGNQSNQTVSDLTNDEIRLQGVKNCIVKNCNIHDSAGGAIALYNSARNQILNNRLTNIHDNGVVIANLGSDYNLVQGNKIDGTTSQNGIFLTASSGSTSTTDKIYGNEVLANWVFNAGDTGIESGIHAIGTIIKANHVFNSKNPAVLVREGQFVVVEGNEVDMSNAPTGGNRDGISIISQLSDSNHIDSLYSICKGNMIRGANRYGIMVQGHSNVTFEGNEITTCTYGFYITNSDHKIRGNDIADCTKGISLDEAGSTNCDHAIIENNTILRADQAIIIYYKTLTDVIIRFNRIKDSNTYTLNATGSTAQNSFFYGNNMVGTGSEVNPTIFSRQPKGASDYTIPLTQYTPILLAKSTDIGLVIIRFGSDYAILYVALGTYTIISHSANVYTDLTGFNGWGIGIDSNSQIILQRRGPTITGNIPYALSFVNA